MGLQAPLISSRTEALSSVIAYYAQVTVKSRAIKQPRLFQDEQDDERENRDEHPHAD